MLSLGLMLPDFVKREPGESNCDLELIWELPNTVDGGAPCGVKELDADGGAPAGVSDKLNKLRDFPGVEGGLESKGTLKLMLIWCWLV